jgi:solute carrier family 50 protein (sugar transporter)
MTFTYSTEEIVFDYLCPFLGCLIASTLFAAPVNDLRKALKERTLGPLNPNPWAVLTGNCLGWSSYAYYTNDPFILASNLPGLILSFWLNIGACKLQYLAQVDLLLKQQQQQQQRQQHSTNHQQEIFLIPERSKEILVSAPQDVSYTHLPTYMETWATP